MTIPVPIQSLTPVAIRRTVGALLESARPMRAISDWMADVDWSLTDGPADEAVVSLLGDLLALTTEVAEGDISREEFMARVRALAEGTEIEADRRASAS